MKGDLTKLPRWAQDEFQVLKNRLEDAERTIATLGAKATEFDVAVIHDGLRGEYKVPGGKYAALRARDLNYFDKAGKPVYGYLDAYVEGCGLMRLSCDNGCIKVIPQAGNAILVLREDWGASDRPKTLPIARPS